MIAALLLVTPIVLSLMPGTWWDRMGTIQNYEQDASAMGRINAWTYAVNLALDRPLVGGGFQAFNRQLFYKYAPVPEDFHDAHSIYFEVLAEQGFVGFFLFLGLGARAFFTAGGIVRRTRDRPELRWANDLGSMLQVSLVGYAVGGTFLGMAYFDLFYHLCALVVLTHVVVKTELEAQPAAAPPHVQALGGRTP
jgi:probable O-glycosylation ligase (exosortase A-associated)